MNLGLGETFGRLGVIGRPSWALAGSAIDMDFAHGRYFGGSLAALLSCARASTGYAQTAAGFLTPFAANALRISDQGLLVEEARTNLWLQSQTFSSASWAKTASSTASSGIVAPDGTTTVFSFIEDATNSDHAITQNVTVVNATVYSVTIYAKKNTRSRLSFYEGSVTAARATFDLNAGTVLSTAGGGTPSASITSLGSGWYRCIMQFTAGSSAGVNLNIYIQGDAQTGIGAYQGDGTSNLYIWGAQFEAGAFVTSYIPTTTGSVTRASDNITASGALQTLLNALERTVLASLGIIPSIAATPNVINLNNAATTNIALLAASATTAAVRANNTATAATLGSAADFTTTAVKIGSSWGATGDSVVGNNGTAATSANVMVPTANIQIGAGSSSASAMNAYLKRITVWNSRLADAALKTLTA